MKLKAVFLSTCLLISFCIIPAHAVFNHDKQFASFYAVSPWALDAVEEAISLGFGPTPKEERYLPEHLSLPITRESFCSYAIRLIAFQQHSDEDNFRKVVLHYLAEKDLWGQPIPVFNDYGAESCSAMYYLGVIKGREDGIFDPNANITRQEAATFLARTYQSYGGTLPETYNATYTDEENIADWAKESVAAMSAMGIMQGYGDGRFAPNDLYSYEQCLTTLVRLYENLPVSRKNGNIESLYTYDQCMAYVDATDQLAREQTAGTFTIQKIEGEVATLVQTMNAGGMGRSTFYKFVYRNGGMKNIVDFDVCDTGTGQIQFTSIDTPYFSEDGKIFYCLATLEEDIASVHDRSLNPVCHGHKAGTYQIVVDVETCMAQATKL